VRLRNTICLFVVISEWSNSTEEEDVKTKNVTVPTTGIPFQNNEGPLQRDEVKATFNKDEANESACKFISSKGFFLPTKTYDNINLIIGISFHSDIIMPIVMQ
jgi:hypothetical protein